MNLDVPPELLWTIPLAGVRVLALMLIAPVLGHAAVPMRIRAAMGMVIALALAPVALPVDAPADPSTLVVTSMVAREALIGFTFGFGLRVIFGVFAPLGELISIQGGLGAASVLDPASGSSSPVLGVLLQVFGLVVFLALDGHHAMLRGIAASFRHLPIGGDLSFPAATFASVVGMGASVFEVSARLAAPITVVMLVVNVGVGILGRSIPQLNLMALQLPAHIAITLVILGLAANPLANVIGRTLTEFTESSIVAILGGH